jgi:DNA invertase Pin-like site-specific DNA recombinase
VRDLVAAGGVDLVLARDADRITREPGDRAVLDLEAERHGCRWVALDDWGDDSHQGALLKFMRGWIAKGERTKTAERMQRGKRQRAREGKANRRLSDGLGAREEAETDAAEPHT